jgi:WD40 repeat protein
VENERGALPLLAFAAARLWEHRDRERKLLTQKAFEENGRVGGALAKHAEGVLGASGAKTLPLARELFRNLVTTEGTRASRNLDELLSIFPTADERLAAEAVLRELVAARLLTSYEAKADSNERRVEIIHESLLRAWPRLVRWRTQDADGAQLRDQLRQAARLWEERGRPRDLLWTGSSYRELSDWRERHKAGLTATEQSFAGAAARLDGRRRRRRKIGLGALLAVSFAGIAVVTSLWRDAEQAAIRAEASKLLALAEARLQQDPTEALAFATASLELTDTGDARVFVMKALWEAPPAIELIVDSQAARSPSFSPDGTWLAAAGHSTEALVWSEKGGDPIVLPGHQTSPRGSNLARWASNDLLVTGSYRMVGSRVHLWSLPGGERVRTIDFGKPSSWQVGEGLLVAESLETGSATDPEAEVLRSWTLPTGDPVFLGAIDGKKLRTPQPYTGKGPDSDRVHHGGVWSLTRAGSAGENALQRADSQSSSPANDPSQVHVWNLRAWPDARPLALRRNGSWYGAVSRLHPKGDWLVASTASFTRLTFWPLAERYPSVVDGYRTALRPLAFSPDGKWLATSWGRGELRLWPLPGSGTREVRTWSLPDPSLVSSIVFDGKGRFLFVTGNQDRAWIVPLDRSPAQKLRGFSEDTLLAAGAIAPSSRFVATAFWYGEGKKTLRVWNLETGALRDFDLPHVASSEPSTGYSEGIARLSFVNDATLYTAGDGGLRRWDLESGSSELVTAAPPGFGMRAALNAEKGVAITYETRWGLWRDCPKSRLHDLRTGASQELTHFGECSAWSLDAVALDASGTVAATGGLDGIVRVGRLSAREPHLLIGHGGAIDDIAISPDLRWIATTGQDDTIRLWPMPDLSKPPLHTLPHDQLLAKLRSLTNLRVARDRSSPTGWQVEVGRFPGWKQVPTW